MGSLIIQSYSSQKAVQLTQKGRVWPLKIRLQRKSMKSAFFSYTYYLTELNRYRIEVSGVIRL